MGRGGSWVVVAKGLLMLWWLFLTPQRTQADGLGFARTFAAVLLIAGWRLRGVGVGKKPDPVSEAAGTSATCPSRGLREMGEQATPTEAEWEFASRGGLSGKLYAWGDELKPVGKFMANTYLGQFPVKDTGEDDFAGTSPVGSFPEDGYGLYDMAGNVWPGAATGITPIISNTVPRTATSRETRKAPKCHSIPTSRQRKRSIRGPTTSDFAAH